VVNSTTVQAGAQFCNNGGFTFADGLPAQPYPSNVNVSTLIGTITKVTVNLNGMTFPRPRDMDMLLVSPTNANLILMSDVGDLSAASGINYVVDDAAASAMPTGSGSSLSSGTFRPTDFNFAAGDDVFPAPAPASPNSPAPNGSSTLALFNGVDPNGAWKLFINDDGIGGGTGSMTGWCMNFALAPLTTTTSLTSSMNPQIPGANVTFTATVSVTGQTPTGTVTFFDGATNLGTSALAPAFAKNGEKNSFAPEALASATLTTNALPVGLHNITARFNAVSTTGGGGFAQSTSAVLVQRIFDPTAAAINVGGRVMDSNGRPVSYARVLLSGPNGSIYALTNPFGYYRFIEVGAGQNYTITVQRKGYTFDAQLVMVTEDLENLDFIAHPE
jgi:subtilisin-like proprotein convertase family protein